jgi:hypothetical protein
MACSRPGGAVEAANRHLQHGLEALDLKTIVAFSRSDNVASRRVLEKIDMWFVAHEDRGICAVARFEGQGIVIKPPKVTRPGHRLLRCSTCRSSATKSASSRSCARNAATVAV